MRETVAIVGGGIAGLTAAHELVERGFNVHVYERKQIVGGKAASYRSPVGGAPDRAAQNEPGYPREHGFRFFPGWYRHLIDTMARIPYHKAGGGRRRVADNLVSVDANLLAWFDRAPLRLPLQLPRSASDAAATSKFVAECSRLGLNSTEIALFGAKLMQFLLLPDPVRAEKFEGISWWDYLECSEPTRSRAYLDLVRATTSTSIAAKAEEVSAYTIGRLVIRTLLDTVSSVDRVLNGPTSEVWLDPWVSHLKARGVEFHTEMELQSIDFDPKARKVKWITLDPVPLADARRLRRLLARQARNEVASEETRKTVSELIDSLLASSWCSRLPDLSIDKRAQIVEELSQYERPRTECGALMTLLAALERTPSTRVEDAYFVLALPLEQLAYYVNRTTMLTFLAPELRDVVRLSRHMDWMAGVQFYLQAPLDIAPGHVVGLDSNWALTAVEHTQFWDDIALPPNVQGILSVDISAWDKRGRTIRKEAYNCDNHEIATEVWAELKEMLNTRDRFDILRDDMLVGGALTARHSYNIDDSIIDLRDRKKQAFYERARSLKFNALTLAADAELSTISAAGGFEEKFDDGYMWGPRLRFNAEPLLVNRAGSRPLRPGARTSIPNLFLAGDYVKTETDLACMEGANEAARMAVNAILDAVNSLEKRCELWPFSPSRQALEGVTSLGGVAGAAQAVRSATTAAVQLQNRFWKGLATGLLRIQSGSGGRDDARRLRPTTLGRDE